MVEALCVLLICHVSSSAQRLLGEAQAGANLGGEDGGHLRGALARFAAHPFTRAVLADPNTVPLSLKDATGGTVGRS